MAATLLYAVEAVGARACLEVRRAGEREGRRISWQPATTVADALAPLRDLGIDCRINRNAVAIQTNGFGPHQLGACAAGRHLVAGLMQGLLDGAGLPYSVRSKRTSTGVELSYWVVRRPKVF